MDLHSDSQLLQQSIPPLRAMGMALGYSIAVTDLDQYIFYMPSGKLNLGIKPGDPIPEAAAIRKTLETGSLESMRGDIKTFGFPYLVRTFPLRTQKGAIIGACAILQSTEGEDRLRELSKNLSHSMDDLSSSSKEMAQKVDEMKQRSDELMKNMGDTRETINDSKRIAGFIRSVSQQSNILSMNAVIEAARSGERNSGFHVLAHEMRHLAQDTESSMVKIDHILTKIREDSQQNFESVDALHLLVAYISNELTTIFSTIHEISNAAETLKTIASTMLN